MTSLVERFAHARATNSLADLVDMIPYAKWLGLVAREDAGELIVTMKFSNHLIGNPVRFLFVDITRVVNLEFGLQTQSLLFAALAALATRHRVIAGAFTLHREHAGTW